MAPHQQPRWTARGEGLTWGGLGGAPLRNQVDRLRRSQPQGSRGTGAVATPTGTDVWRIGYTASGGANITLMDIGSITRLGGSGEPVIVEHGWARRFLLPDGLWEVSFTALMEASTDGKAEWSVGSTAFSTSGVTAAATAQGWVTGTKAYGSAAYVTGGSQEAGCRFADGLGLVEFDYAAVSVIAKRLP